MSQRKLFQAVAVALLFGTITVGGSHFRIISGRKATTREFPYQMALELHGNQWCGGAIISRRYALTAAHCVKWMENETNIPIQYFAVRVGHDVSSTGGTLYQVEKAFPHEKYKEDDDVDRYDIALLRMARLFVFSDRVQPIGLVKEDPPEGEMSWVTGFGRQEMSRSNEPKKRHLMAVELPVISLRTCQRMLPGVAEDMICAGHKRGHRDACGGDSGGPLAVDGELAGLVAWGFGCGREGVPGVYTSIAHYRRWIYNKMGVQDTDADLF